jgi:uncharacterized protein involved in type VI secretion and phage assembly
MLPATPRSRSTDKRYYGVVEALVEAVDGDDEARVKLRFPWFDDSTVTDWCRMSQLYAGNGYGSVFVPEKGDEVLVAFVHGDMRFPIVLGGLYNGADKPPTARTDGRDQKMIRTKHGHQVVFDDQPSQAAVRITSAAGHVVELDDAGKAIRVRAVEGGTVTVVADVVNVDASKVNLGQGAGASVPLGEALLQAINTHTHPVTGGVTGLPTPVPKEVLSKDVKTR